MNTRKLIRPEKRLHDTIFLNIHSKLLVNETKFIKSAQPSEHFILHSFAQIFRYYLFDISLFCNITKLSKYHDKESLYPSVNWIWKMISVVRCQFGGISNCRLSICSKATSPLCRLTWAGRGAGQRGCSTASWCARRAAGGGPTAATRPRTTSPCQAGHLSPDL